jgi:hypothetical protein
MFGMIWKPLCRADSGQLNEEEAAIGRQKGAGCYPVGIDNMINENRRHGDGRSLKILCKGF